MSDRTEAARCMRESAEQLHRIASLQNFLQAKLTKIARELEASADQLEKNETIREAGARPSLVPTSEAR